MGTVELVGNALCLDFANTVSSRPLASWDLLQDTGSAWEWTQLAGLPGAAPAPTRVAEQGLDALRRLRRATWGVFDAVVDGAPLPERELAALLSAQEAGLREADWIRSTTAIEPVWPAAGRLADLAGPLADSAVRLLRSGPLDRLGRCPSCRWLFLDTSRNGQRRWCSMRTCGSRDKVARYAARQRSSPRD